MSETYSIWHGERNGHGSSTVYLTAINVQEIGSGSDEFIQRLLVALGAADSAIPDWELSEPFLVDHLSSQASEDWRDTWLLTWQLSFATDIGTDVPVDPVDLTIWDETWNGKESAPAAFEIVATGQGHLPEIGEVEHASSRRCPLGHVHVRVPVQDGGTEAAAAQAKKLETVLSDAGWSTQWRARG